MMGMGRNLFSLGSSYDARNEEVEARHLTLKDDWGLRLYFRVWPNNRRSPALMIQDLKPADSGVFRCRVDYRNSPTTNSLTRLKIIGEIILIKSLHWNIMWKALLVL